MAKYTNIYNLPAQFARTAIAITERYEYGEGVFRSNTGLISPPQQMALMIRYRDRLVIDVSELVFAITGQAHHYLLENMPGEEYLREASFRFEVAGKLIQTTLDLYNLLTNVLSDWKVTSLYGVTKKEPKPEWSAQLNIGAHALREHDFNPKRLEIIAILRDWSKKKARIEHYKPWTSYPKHQVVKVDVPMWTPEATVEYITERIELHDMAEQLSDADLAIEIPCSPEERWEKPPTFAVKKRGRASAVRVLPSFAEAHAYMDEKGFVGHPDYTIETRMGESPRCTDYCAVCDYCHQWREIKHLYLEEAA